jgi:hypothetical protein
VVARNGFIQLDGLARSGLASATTMIEAPAKIVSTTLELLSYSTRRPCIVPICSRNTDTVIGSLLAILLTPKSLFHRA